MTNLIYRKASKIWDSIWPRPKRIQVAALCYKHTKKGIKVLLITSRDTGRWIVPKGWPIKGKDGPGSALQEAWEEAGVSKADIQEKPLGHFGYVKRLRGGDTVPIKAQVYLTHVRNLKKSYPEKKQRKRAWFEPQKAAELVDEPGLSAILRAL
ncbi:MAG: NUDIX hydrolase [Sulfitobacter sp.]